MSVPAPLLLLLPQLGQEESQGQQPDEEGQHTQGQRQAQRPVDRALAGFALVTQHAVTHQTGAATVGDHTGTAVIAPGLSTGGQAVVDASRLGRRDGGRHRRGGGGEKGGKKKPGLLREGEIRGRRERERGDEWKEATPYNTLRKRDTDTQPFLYDLGAWQKY